MPNITERLQSLYISHRIVFWYDEEQEFRHDFDNLELDSVEKCEVKNNEFAIKVKILHRQPKFSAKVSEKTNHA